MAIRYQYESLFEPVSQDAEAVRIDKWFQQPSEPVRVKPQIVRTQEFFFIELDLVVPEVVTVDKWFQPVSEPVRTRPEIVRSYFDTDAESLLIQVVSFSFAQSAFLPETDEVYLALLTLSHDDIDPSIRVVNNTQNIVSNSNTFTAFPFDVTLPDSTGDSPPRFKLVIDNVTREIAQQIRLISSPLTITLQIIRAADPDVIEKEWVPFTLRNVKWDFLKMQGDLVVENMLTEPYPGGDFSPAFFPGGF